MLSLELNPIIPCRFTTSCLGMCCDNIASPEPPGSASDPGTPFEGARKVSHPSLAFHSEERAKLVKLSHVS